VVVVAEVIQVVVVVTLRISLKSMLPEVVVDRLIPALIKLTQLLQAAVRER
jgi:hypothetical protein